MELKSFVSRKLRRAFSRVIKLQVIGTAVKTDTGSRTVYTVHRCTPSSEVISRAILTKYTDGLPNPRGRILNVSSLHRILMKQTQKWIVQLLPSHRRIRISHFWRDERGDSKPRLLTSQWCLHLTQQEEPEVKSGARHRAKWVTGIFIREFS